MNKSTSLGIAMVAGAALGAAAVHGLHAQAKPPVYQITEIEFLDRAAYERDYVPKAQAAIRAAGGKFLAAGSTTTTVEGAPVKNRVTIQQWDSVEKIQAYRNSTAFKDFTVPALLLGIVVGGSALVAALIALFGPHDSVPFEPWRFDALASAVAGCIMVGWISIEMVLIGLGSWLQPFYFAVGLLMIGLARLLQWTETHRGEASSHYHAHTA